MQVGGMAKVVGNKECCLVVYNIHGNCHRTNQLPVANRLPAWSSISYDVHLLSAFWETGQHMPSHYADKIVTQPRTHTSTGSTLSSVTSLPLGILYQRTSSFANSVLVIAYPEPNPSMCTQPNLYIQANRLIVEFPFPSVTKFFVCLLALCSQV